MNKGKKGGKRSKAVLYPKGMDPEDGAEMWAKQQYEQELAEEDKAEWHLAARRAAASAAKSDIEEDAMAIAEFELEQVVAHLLCCLSHKSGAGLGYCTMSCDGY